MSSVQRIEAATGEDINLNLGPRSRFCVSSSEASGLDAYPYGRFIPELTNC
ncbi:hypothetical protein ABIE67_000544 [Streptomyces sp. V4I8]